MDQFQHASSWMVFPLLPTWEAAQIPIPARSCCFFASCCLLFCHNTSTRIVTTVALPVRSVVPLNISAGDLRQEAANTEEGNGEWSVALGGKGTLRPPFWHQSQAEPGFQETPYNEETAIPSLPGSSKGLPLHFVCNATAQIIREIETTYKFNKYFSHRSPYQIILGAFQDAPQHKQRHAALTCNQATAMLSRGDYQVVGNRASPWIICHSLKVSISSNLPHLSDTVRQPYYK